MYPRPSGGRNDARSGGHATGASRRFRNPVAAALAPCWPPLDECRVGGFGTATRRSAQYRIEGRNGRFGSWYAPLAPRSSRQPSGRITRRRSCSRRSRHLARPRARCPGRRHRATRPLGRSGGPPCTPRCNARCRPPRRRGRGACDGLGDRVALHGCEDVTNLEPELGVERERARVVGRLKQPHSRELAFGGARHDGVHQPAAHPHILRARIVVIGPTPATADRSKSAEFFGVVRRGRAKLDARIDVGSHRLSFRSRRRS